jgi:UDP-N-acetylglucosamine 2-epimerase
VFVHGDTASAMAAAVAASNMRIPVGHVEAGLRTFSTLTRFPEELNRHVISRIASFHLAPTSVNAENLVREGVCYEQVFVTGNTGIDAPLRRRARGVDDRHALVERRHEEHPEELVGGRSVSAGSRVDRLAGGREHRLDRAVRTGGRTGAAPAIFNVAGFWDHDGWLALLFFFLLGFGGAKTAREPISERT